MLINKIRKSYRDLIRHADPVQAIVTVPNVRPAANASDFSQSEMLERSLRRQRRVARVGQHSSAGWRVRAW